LKRRALSYSTLRDLARGVRPHAVLDEGAHVLLVGKARHLVVRLRGKTRRGEATLRVGCEKGKPAAVHEVVHQRG